MVKFNLTFHLLFFFFKLANIWRVCVSTGLSARFSAWWSRCNACMRMRLRTELTETVGGRPAGRRRFRFPMLWGGQRGQAVVNNVSTTDGYQSPREEPQIGQLTSSRRIKNIHPSANITYFAKLTLMFEWDFS